jgi:transglutaminase-like putative cysteine protease
VKFGRIHRVLIDTLAVLGLLALISSGQLTRPVSVSLLIALSLALLVPEHWQDRLPMRSFAVVAPLALLALQIARSLLGESILQIAVQFAAALQVIRLATRRGASHDQQVIVLALLHLIAGTVFGGGLAYALCFVGFLIVAPGALVLSHLRREVEGNYRQGARDRTGLPVDVPRILRSRRVVGLQFLAITCLLSLPIFVFTAVLFLLFPRVGLSLFLLGHSRPERMIGFSDTVDLGGVGKLRTDPTIALRVTSSRHQTNPPPRLALYLRGTAFDHYDGRTWSRTRTRHVPLRLQGSTLLIRRHGRPSTNHRLSIHLEPIDPPVLFLPHDTVALQLAPHAHPVLTRLPTLFAGPEGQFRYSTPDHRGIHYDVFLPTSQPLPPLRLADPERPRYLTLPPNLPARIAERARAWTAHAATSQQQAKAIETRLREAYSYDLESPSGSAANPLDHFLFESRRGHCEFYSTAMAIMLRTLGVPTRNVTGFVGGTYNRFGHYYAVRQGDAHSWIEAYIDGTGWVRFDPTPPANATPQSEITGAFAYTRDLIEALAQRWSQHVVGYDLPQQLRLFRSARLRYSQLRGPYGLLRNPFSSPRRTAVVLSGLALLALGLYWLRRTRRARRVPPTRPSPQQVAALQVVQLYESLESVMAARGLPRHPATPPDAHARALREINHPIASEVIELTELYQQARYGGHPLDEAERRQFALRVRALKRTPPTRAVV